MTKRKDKKKVLVTLIVLGVLLSSFIGIVSASPYFVGSKNSDVYHYPSCHYVDRIKPENLIYFDTPEDAIAKGYRPCKGCNPPTKSPQTPSQTPSLTPSPSPTPTLIPSPSPTVSPSPTPSPSPSPSPVYTPSHPTPTSTPSFEFLFAIMGILAAIYLIRQKG